MNKSIAIPAQGTVWEVEDTASTPVWHPVGGMLSFNMAEGEPTENDETVLTSTALEYSTGLPNSGQFTGNLQYNRGDAGQAELHKAKTESTPRNFRLTLSDGRVATFVGLVKNVPFSGSPNQRLDGQFTVRITGAVTWS